MYYYISLAILVAIALWTIGSYVVVWTIEAPAYTVIEKRQGYEIRQYKPYIMATTEVTGDYASATNQGFRVIADYIFGNNTKKEGIAMTTPVLEAPSEKIAMTTPVLESVTENAGTRLIAFVMPSKYTLETLPQPNNPQVKLIAVPKRTVAALRYTWYPTENRTNKMKDKLQSLLLQDKEKIAGVTETARYNPPLSMPLTLRNEILIPIE